MFRKRSLRDWRTPVCARACLRTTYTKTKSTEGLLLKARHLKFAIHVNEDTLTGPLRFKVTFFHRRRCSWWRNPILDELENRSRLSHNYDLFITVLMCWDCLHFVLLGVCDKAKHPVMKGLGLLEQNALLVAAHLLASHWAVGGEILLSASAKRSPEYKPSSRCKETWKRGVSNRSDVILW